MKTASDKIFSRNLLYSIRVLLFSLIALSFYLLLLSRAGEVHTVWESLHFAFLPTYFLTTFLLFVSVFLPEKTGFKLLFTIAHSILSHSFFVIIFPAGDISGQQMILGRTRLIYENVILHGWPPWPVESLHQQIYQWFRGINFQTALSVIFARMLNIDVFWSHLFLVPILWGAFVPLAAFLIFKSLGRNENASVFSGILVSVFPHTIYWGAISVPNSLGYIFFFYSILFMLKYLNSNKVKTKFFVMLMLLFVFISFLSHYLAGILSISLLLLILPLKAYRTKKFSSQIVTRVSLFISLILSVCLLPTSLIYLKFFDRFQPSFSLSKLYNLSFIEIFGVFFLGEYVYSVPITTFLFSIGSLIAFLYILICLLVKNQCKFNLSVVFLILALIIVSIIHGILELFMEGVPFNEERILVFRDFLTLPFIIFTIDGFSKCLVSKTKATQWSSKPKNLWSKKLINRAINLSKFILKLLLVVALTSWITLSVVIAYPHIAPLQTTWYELEAVRFIHKNTLENYIVIGDQWIIFAGETVAGIYNPKAYYFGEFDPEGIFLFNRMKTNPTNKVMKEALSYNNATVAYFIIQKSRLGTDVFNRILKQALENNLEVYAVFGGGRLYVFRYKELEKK
jgi:hypothetical protein